MNASGNVRWIGWLLVVVVVVGSISLWKISRLSDCCEELKRGLSPTGKTDGGGSGMAGPTPGPIISVGPSGGSPNTTSWKMGDPPGTGGVAFGSSGYLRDDAGGRWKMLEARYGSSKVSLAKLTIVFDSDKKLVIEKDNASPPKLIWTFDGEELLPCDYEITNTRVDCSNDGIPPEFNGTIKSFTTVPAVSDTTVRVFAQGNN